MAVEGENATSGADGDVVRARIAALNMLHGRAGVRFLAANGRHEHAGALEAALDEIADLLRTQIGADLFTAALAWAERHLDRDGNGIALLSH